MYALFLIQDVSGYNMAYISSFLMEKNIRTPLQMFQSSTLCLGQRARKLPMHMIYFLCVYNKNDRGHRLPRQLNSFITLIRRIKK